MEVDDTCEGFFDLVGLWDTTITLLQASEQIEKETECENLLENITLSQAIDLYNPGPADMESNYFVDFDLLAKKEGGSYMPVGRYEHFVNDNDLKDLLNSTENKNTRKNTNWSVTTFNDWRSARLTMTGARSRIFWPSQQRILIFGYQGLLLKRDARMARPTFLKHFTCFVLDS